MNDLFVPRFPRRCGYRKTSERNGFPQCLPSNQDYPKYVPRAEAHNESRVSALLSRLGELSEENRALKAELAVLMRMKEAAPAVTADSAVQTGVLDIVNDQAADDDYRASCTLFGSTYDFRALQAGNSDNIRVSYVSDSDLGAQRWLLEMRGYQESDLDFLGGPKLSECGCCVDSFCAEQ